MRSKESHNVPAKDIIVPPELNSVPDALVKLFGLTVERILEERREKETKKWTQAVLHRGQNMES